MKTVIRIGSRESRLAVTQTEIIKGQIEAHFPHIRVEIVTMKTTGDRILDRSRSEEKVCLSRSWIRLCERDGSICLCTA